MAGENLEVEGKSRETLEKGMVSWHMGCLFPAPHRLGQRGLVLFFSPQNIWGYIRHRDLVNKMVMEICNRETLSKASLKSPFNPQPSREDWKLENLQSITGPSKWPKFNPICRFKDG